MDKYFIVEMIIGTVSIIAFPSAIVCGLHNDFELGLIFAALPSISGILFFTTLQREEEASKKVP